VPLNLRPFPRDYLPLSLAIEPKSKDDASKFAEVMQGIVANERGYAASIDEESGQARFDAMSEGELDAALQAVHLAGVAVNIGAPQVAYREILAAPVEADYTHRKQTGASGQFARVKMRFEPNSRSMSNTFVNSASPDAVPPQYIPGVERGVLSVIRCGPRIGFPVVACRTVLLDGAWHDADSSELAFEIAGRAAFREAAPGTAMKVLEPYLEVNITTPEPFAAAVISDFKSRRGVNNAKELSPGVVAIYGFVPVANAFGYAAHLASMTQDAATYDWKLAGLEEVPMDRGDSPFTSAAALRG
jgi:elongation factor G